MGSPRRASGACRWATFRWRIQKDTALQRAFGEISDQGTDVARAICRSWFGSPQGMNVSAIVLRKEVDVGFVTRIVFALRRHFHLFVAQDKGSNRRIERKPEDSAARGVHEDSRGAVEDVAGRTRQLPGCKTDSTPAGEESPLRR